MPPWTVSYDPKLRIPILRHVQGLSTRKICEVLGIRKSLVYQTLQVYDKLADAYQLKFTQTRPSVQSQLRGHQLHQVPQLFTQFSPR
ncbi:hypothetical protein BDR04DRAFT_792972 [Suillus decipiens]|nr:hypothetical protein BDR04DRAFT_792972 [Suillus decipiens]